MDASRNQGAMESRSKNGRLAARFEPYVSELREFFADRGLRSGSPSDLAPLVDAFARPGSMHEEMVSMTSAIVLCEGGAVSRAELLELVMTAISGFGVDQAAEEDRWAIDAADAFVGEVIRSLKRRTSDGGDDEQQEPETPPSPRAPLPAIARLPRPLLAPAPPPGTYEALSPLKWNFNQPVEQRPTSLPSGEVFLRAQTIFPRLQEAPRQPEPPPPPTPSSPPSQSSTEIVMVKPIPVRPVVLPPDHFFRATMGLLAVALGLALLWRHGHPIQTAETPTQTQAASASDASISPPAPTADSAAASNPAGAIVVGVAGSEATAAALLEARQAGMEPSFGLPQSVPESVPQGKPDISPPTGSEQVPALPPAAAPGAQPTPAPNADLPRPSRRRRAPIPAPIPGATPAVSVPQPPPPGKQGAFLVSSGVMANNLLAAPPPKYPKMASMAGIEGQVILQAVVSRNGDVVATHVLDGHHMLRGAAVNAVRGWHYRPYMVRGRPTDMATIVILEFRLPH